MIREDYSWLRRFPRWYWTVCPPVSRSWFPGPVIPVSVNVLEEFYVATGPWLEVREYAVEGLFPQGFSRLMAQVGGQVLDATELVD